MNPPPRILAINPGSTSTRLAVFQGDEEITSLEACHKKEELVALGPAFAQLELRKALILSELEKRGVDLAGIDCFVGRGGVLPPIPGGVYEISSDMLADTRQARFGEHACNLGCHLAMDFASKYAKPCFVVDPPSTDEVIPMAKITGLKEIKRRFLTHALSQRGIGRIAARDLGLDYNQARMIVAHLGGGISMGAHKNGRIQDAITSYDGEGPFSPERSGAIPALDILKLVEEGEDVERLRKRLITSSGLWSLLGSSDLREVEQKAAVSQEHLIVMQAMAYNIAKGIAQMAPILHDAEDQGPVDAIILTGGMVRWQNAGGLD